MHVVEAIQERRSVKHFDARHQMSAAEERKLIELAMLSPTAFHLQNWRFLLVKNPDLRKAIRAVAWDQEQVTDASLLVVLCADLNAWDKNAKQYWSHTPKN